MSENEMKLRFELTTGYGEHYVQESYFEVFEDESEVDCIGEKLNVFLKQVSYVRDHDYIFMESVTEEERDALADYLCSLREGKNAEGAG